MGSTLFARDLIFLMKFEDFRDLRNGLSLKGVDHGGRKRGRRQNVSEEWKTRASGE